MSIEINNNLSVQNQTNQAIQYKAPVNSETTKTSGISAENNVSATNSANVAGSQQKMPSLYEQNQSKIVLEQEMDKLLKQIMPNLGVKFRVHESGSIITTITNNDTQEVVREFPAEKILDIVYSMCQKLGIVTNKKV